MVYKTCKTCQKLLSCYKFRPRNKECRDCDIIRYKETRRVYKARIRDWYREYKSTFSCIKCGEANRFCLEFIYKEKQGHGIYNAVRDCWKIDRIKDEINKCIPICANCNAKQKYKLKSKNPRSIKILNLKTGKSCFHCGESTPECLEFHHPNDNKVDSVSNLRDRSKKVIIDEVEKCECVCRNCHRKIHQYD